MHELERDMVRAAVETTDDVADLLGVALALCRETCGFSERAEPLIRTARRGLFALHRETVATRGAA